MADPQEILKRYWGYEDFRPLQKDIVQSALSGKDTLAILPTGGGKSICFQVPALAQPGICIVISPLIALMKDQVDNLKKRGIPALLIHSGMKKADVIRTLKNATGDYFKFLYVSPERLETSLFHEYLPSLDVNLIAVDEAHCISQWGYDFRPSYLRIAALRKELPGVPLLALTASATAAVQEDIMSKLEFGEPRVFRQSFERKNLSYSVFQAQAKLVRLVEIVKKVPGTAIVYCESRKRTHEITQLLQMHGISASNYHAGLQQEERAQRQKDWIENKVRVMACTNAFGMGIDKPDVRLVIHADMPDCLENYYQEAGRAGRDGKKSYAVLLYGEKDISELEEMHKLRFPTIDQIRHVYQCLVNFLQIPSYSGEYKSFQFRLEDFVRNFKLDTMGALYALKALEQDGWIEFNERSYAPSTLVFTSSKANLYEFYKSHPLHEPLLTTLLRTYGGIFDFPAFISENLLARLMKKEEAEIRRELQTIASFGMVSYTPQNDEPQLVFLRQRVPVEDLLFRTEPYNKRKETFIRRAKAMIAYARSSECRSLFINHYFGDEKAKACGVCDNCLNAGSGEPTSEEFKKFSVMVFESLREASLPAADLLGKMKGLKKEKAWKIIEFLQAENKIELDQAGRLKLK